MIPKAQVYVWDGNVVQVVDLETDKAFTKPSTIERYPTVAALFDEIDTALPRNPDRIEIEHNRYLGYPSRIFIDPSLRTADDELDYKLGDFYLLER